MNETEMRDARRGQLMGMVWLHLWQAQGRGKRRLTHSQPLGFRALTLD